MSTVRSLHLIAPRTLVWRDVPEPVVEAPGDAIVRPIVMTTCDIDPLLISGATGPTRPGPIGHEAIGEVVAIGDAVTTVRPGDRVVMPYFDSCGACSRCRRAHHNRCLKFSPDLAHRRWHGVGLTDTGLFSERVRVVAADQSLIPLPVTLDPTHMASLGDNIGFAWEFVMPALSERPGADVLVMGGCGSIALYAVAFAVAGGAARVVYHDRDPDRRAIAKHYGAQVVDGDPPRDFGSFPIAIDASARDDSLLCAIRSTEVEGRCFSVGGHFRPIALPLFEMYAKGIHFYTGPGRGLANVAGALRMIVEHGIDMSVVTSGIHPLSRAAEILSTYSLKPVFLA